jgi:hypothetical protein
MGTNPSTLEMLGQATRYALIKCDRGLTVGIHIGDDYGEAFSPGGDLHETVRLAYRNAQAHGRRDLRAKAPHAPVT